MNMKRILPLLLSLAMALALCACGSQSSSDGAQTSVSGSTGVEDGVLTVGMECAYAPYNWTQMDDSNGAVPISNVPGSYANGYDVMIAKKICEANGWKLEIVSSAWESLIPAVQAGSMDANIAGQSMTADRLDAGRHGRPVLLRQHRLPDDEGQPLRRTPSPSPTSPAADAPPSPARSGMTPACPRSTGANIHRPRRQRPRDDHAAADRHGRLRLHRYAHGQGRRGHATTTSSSSTSPARTATSSIPPRRSAPRRSTSASSVRKGNTALKDAINSVLDNDDPRRLQRPHGSGHRHPARGVNSADIPMRGGPAGPPHRLKGASVWIS